MLNISRLFCSAITACMLFVSGLCYAGTVTTRVPMEIMCAESSFQANSYSLAGNPKVQLSLDFNGIWAKGYTKGLIMIPITEMDDEMLDTLTDSDYKLACGVTGINVKAKCGGSGKRTSIKPGMMLACNKGDGLRVTMNSPRCPGMKKIKKGMFTITETRDIEDEEETMMELHTNSTDSTDVYDTQDVFQSSKSKEFVVGGKGKNKCMIQ